eukprot:361247-Chlamydomonas_euryale.AAC.3
MWQPYPRNHPPRNQHQPQPHPAMMWQPYPRNQHQRIRTIHSESRGRRQESPTFSTNTTAQSHAQHTMHPRQQARESHLDRIPKVRQVACRNEAVAAIVPRACQDQHGRELVYGVLCRERRCA